MMVITGTNDNSSRTGQPWTWRLQPYEDSPAGGKHLVVIDGAYHNFGGINGAPDSHEPGSPDAGPRNDAHVMYVRCAGLAFLDAYVKLDPAAQTWLAGDDIEHASAGEIAYEYR